MPVKLGRLPFPRQDSPEYRADYNAGWRYSQSGAANLDVADRKGNSDSDAWMDGYLDLATGREKWHMLHCKNHEGH